MKTKIFQGIIYLVIYFLFANHAWAADWIFYASTSTRDAYYDKSSIKKVNKNVISLYTKQILNENGKTQYFSFLKKIDKAPDNPNLLSYVLRLSEIDCVKERIKDYSMIIYDEKSNGIYSTPKDVTDKWNDIIPNSIGEKLKNIVCERPVAPNSEEPVAPKEAIAPAVTDKIIAQISNKQNKTRYIHEEDVKNLVTKWLNSWKSGDLKTYHSCYASDFNSKGMNLDAWVSHKANVYQKSKNINISIDKLQISADGNFATAVFTQSYSSSILKDSGEKTLELRKINDKWKIYREIM
jgi:ketosteroid isomerase-like protein